MFGVLFVGEIYPMLVRRFLFQLAFSPLTDPVLLSFFSCGRVSNADRRWYPEFADCARGRTITVAWNCRAQHHKMNSCMIKWATKAEEDAAREEWFQGVLDRRRQREEELAAVEKRRQEVIELTRKQEEKEALEAARKLAADKEGEAKKKSGSSWWR